MLLIYYVPSFLILNHWMENKHYLAWYRPQNKGLVCMLYHSTDRLLVQTVSPQVSLKDRNCSLVNGVTLLRLVILSLLRWHAYWSLQWS